MTNKGIVTSEARWPVTWLAVLAMFGGCAEAPRIADDEADSEESSAESEEHRTHDTSGEDAFPAGDWQQVALDAGAPMETDEAPPRSEEEEEAPPSEPESEDEQGLVSDAGMDATSDAFVESASDAAQDVADAGLGGPSEDAALPLDLCAVDPCQHGGVCSAEADRYTCACPEGYAGEHCERKVCGSVSIRARADVEAHRECGEIRGDLRIASVGMSEITADDFPFLTRIVGKVIVSGTQTTDGPSLASVTLASLQEIGGAVAVVGVAVPEFGGSGPLRELHLPALRRIGAHEGLGLAVFQASLKVLDLPALETIEGAVLLDTLFELCSVNVDNVSNIGGTLTVNYVPRVSSAQLEPLRSAAAEPGSERLLGCCGESSDERVACDGFTERARTLYCTGC